jgi:multidrug efflux pump
MKGIKILLKHFFCTRWMTFLIIGAIGIFIALLWWLIPSEMAPLEDRSQVKVNISMPEGATYEYTP